MIFEFTLKDGSTIDGTMEELLAKGYTAADIAIQAPLYKEGEDKALTTSDINALLEH